MRRADALDEDEQELTMRGKIIWLTVASAVLVVGGTVVVGPARAKNIRTREIHGTFEYRGVGQYGTGQLEMRWKAAGSLVEQRRGPMGVITRGYDGTRTWGSHPQRGVRQLSSHGIDEIRLVAALFQPIVVQHRYHEPSHEGRRNLRGREVAPSVIDG